MCNAIKGVKSGKYLSLGEAAEVLSLLQSTLYHRAKGWSTRIQAHEHEQLLLKEEETELSRWIHRLTDAGYPPKPHTVRDLAETIRLRHVIGINDSTVTHVSYGTIRHQWVKCFLANPDLKSLIAEPIESVRVKETSPDIIQKYFDKVNTIIKNENITPRNIYNMDETGCSIGNIKASCVNIDKT